MRTAARSDPPPDHAPSETNAAKATANNSTAMTVSARHAALGSSAGSRSSVSAIEAAVVYCLIILYIWWIQFWFRPFVDVLLLAVIVSHAIRRETPTALGFRLTNLRTCLARYGPFVLLLAGGALLAGAALHTVRAMSLASALGILAGYCVWGLFQQYVLNGYFVNRFLQSVHSTSVSSAVPLLAGFCFAGVHALNWYLMAVTFIAGTLSAFIYVRYRNLYFLGVAHGVVGTVLYLVSPDSIAHHFRVGPGMFR